MIGIAYGEILDLDGYDAFGNAVNTVRMPSCWEEQSTMLQIPAQVPVFNNLLVYSGF